MKLPSPPKPPVRSELWHMSHTREEFNQYKRELKLYDKQYLRYLKLIHSLKVKQPINSSLNEIE